MGLSANTFYRRVREYEAKQESAGLSASDGHRTQQIEIHFRFDVAVATAIADSKEYDKKKI